MRRKGSASLRDAFKEGSLATASASPSPARDDGDSEVRHSEQGEPQRKRDVSQLRHPEQCSLFFASTSSKDPSQNASRSDAHISSPTGKPAILHAPRRTRVANRRATLASCVIAVVALVAVALAGVALGDAASASDLALKNLAPSLAHPFGTDNLGRDMLARTVAGLATSIGIGLSAAVVSSIIALALGCAAALGGRGIDTAITWLVDLMMGIPHIVLMLLVSYALGKGTVGVAVAVAITHWPSLTRVVRAEVLQVKGSTYVQVAEKLGASKAQIVVRHILPAVFPQYLVGLILLFPHAILHEAALTFLGFGLPPELPAIGVILSESMNYLSVGMWWLAVFPGLALLAVVLLFDMAGQGIRKLIDPARAQE